MKKTITYSIIASIITATIARPSKASETNAQIAFVGDSMAYGMAVATSSINGGIVGAGISRIHQKDNALYWTQKADQAQIVMIEIGTNDFSEKNQLAYVKDLDAYILPITAKKPACIILPPATQKKSIKTGLEKISQTINQWANNKNIPAISLTIDESHRAGDKMHFDIAGYKEMGRQSISECLSKLYEPNK